MEKICLISKKLINCFHTIIDNEYIINIFPQKDDKFYKFIEVDEQEIIDQIINYSKICYMKND